MEPDDVLPNILRARGQREPDRPFLTEVEGSSATYGEFWGQASRWARVLHDAGVGEGDTVVTMQPNTIRAYEVWMAVAMLGAIEVPVNTEYVGRLLQHVVDNSGARVMVVAEQFADQVAEAADRFDALELVLLSDARHATSWSAASVACESGLARFEEARSFDEGRRFEPWDTSMILYTSGTTGPSKGVITPWAQFHEATIGSAPPHAYRVESSVLYSPYPTFHVSGKIPFYGIALGGGRMVLRERFSTKAFWEDIRAHGCTSTLLMGATANFVYRQPERPDDADNPLEIIIFSPWIPEIEAFKRRFDVAGCSVFNMTEISAPIVSGWEGEVIEDPRSCGRVRPGFDLRVVDDRDRELPSGTVGELVVRADDPWKLMAGYWRMPDKTVEAWRNLWFHTGDLFSVDEAGNYTFEGRKKDAIRRRGENISASEVEEAALDHPAILEAAAVAVPDEVSEEEVKLAVTVRPGMELDRGEYEEFLASRLPRFMVPRYVEVLPEMPKTPTEKIQKSELRDAGVGQDTWDRTDGVR